MPIMQEQIPMARISPTGWSKLKNGHYADPNMLSDTDGKPLTDINFYQAHRIAHKLGIMLTDDIDFNYLMDSNPEAANQTRKYAVWTSLLKNVERDAKTGGYKAKHIARPEPSFVDGKYVAKGKEKAIKLPEDGFFKIRELLESETGLPTQTYGGDVLDEPCAYWLAAEGSERPVLRGGWCLSEHGQFGAIASWESLSSSSRVGARVASDSEPSPILKARA